MCAINAEEFLAVVAKKNYFFFKKHNLGIKLMRMYVYIFTYILKIMLEIDKENQKKRKKKKIIMESSTK